MRSMFEAVATSTDFPDKPSPDMLLDISKRIQIPPSKCLVVGDHIFDLLAANAASMPCVIVLSGDLDSKKFSDIHPQPLDFCKDINEIPKFIQSHNSK